MTKKELEAEVVRLRAESAELRKLLADAIQRTPLLLAPITLPLPQVAPLPPFQPWPGYPHPYVGDWPITSDSIEVLPAWRAPQPGDGGTFTWSVH